MSPNDPRRTVGRPPGPRRRTTTTTTERFRCHSSGALLGRIRFQVGPVHTHVHSHTSIHTVTHTRTSDSRVHILYFSTYTHTHTTQIIYIYILKVGCVQSYTSRTRVSQHKSFDSSKLFQNNARTHAHRACVIFSCTRPIFKAVFVECFNSLAHTPCLRITTIITITTTYDCAYPNAYGCPLRFWQYGAVYRWPY